MLFPSFTVLSFLGGLFELGGRSPSRGTEPVNHTSGSPLDPPFTVAKHREPFRTVYVVASFVSHTKEVESFESRLLVRRKRL